MTYTPERRNEEDREKVLVRLTPRSLNELYIETKELSKDDQMYGHSAECDLCGEQVDFDEAIPNGAGDPYYRSCSAEAYGAPDWFVERAKSLTLEKSPAAASRITFTVVRISLKDRPLY